VNLKPNEKRNRKTTPSASDSAQKRAHKQPSPHSIEMGGGGGGQASESENAAPQRKEPENAPDTTPFIPKGALIHTKRSTNAHPKTAISGSNYNPPKTLMTTHRSQLPKTPYPKPQLQEAPREGFEPSRLKGHWLQIADTPFVIPFIFIDSHSQHFCHNVHSYYCDYQQPIKK